LFFVFFFFPPFVVCFWGCGDVRESGLDDIVPLKTEKFFSNNKTGGPRKQKVFTSRLNIRPDCFLGPVVPGFALSFPKWVRPLFFLAGLWSAAIGFCFFFSCSFSAPFLAFYSSALGGPGPPFAVPRVGRFFSPIWKIFHFPRRFEPFGTLGYFLRRFGISRT